MELFVGGTESRVDITESWFHCFTSRGIPGFLVLVFVFVVWGGFCFVCCL